VPDVALPLLDEAEAIRWVLERKPASLDSIIVDKGFLDGSARSARRSGAPDGCVSGDRTKERLRSGLLRRLQAARDEEVGFMGLRRLSGPRRVAWGGRPGDGGQRDLMLGAGRPNAAPGRLTPVSPASCSSWSCAGEPAFG